MVKKKKKNREKKQTKPLETDIEVASEYAVIDERKKKGPQES